MKDITDLVARYRLALRHIWNSCYWVDPALRGWESVYSFRELKKPLFKALVADALGADLGSEIFGRGFTILPMDGEPPSFQSLQVNRREPSSLDGGIWKPVPGPFYSSDSSLTLLDFFDWSPLGYIDLRYYLVQIDKLRGHEDLIGHQALVEVVSGRVMWTEMGTNP